ncbi:MAG: hypothetical protein ACRDYX_03975 [Egibacteraceae bacterium]
MTTEVLLRQPPELIASWPQAGYLGLDMESSATLSAAAWLGMRRLALLHAWDDPLPADDAARRTAAALFDLALETCLSPA